MNGQTREAGEEHYPDIYQPSPLALKARRRRNIAMGLLLLVFVMFVFISVIARIHGSSS